MCGRNAGRAGHVCSADAAAVAEALREEVAHRTPVTPRRAHRLLRAPGSTVPVCGFEEDPAIAAGIEAASAPAATEATRWSAEELVRLAELLTGGSALTEIAAELQVAPAVVKDMVGGFGTWAGKQFGPAADDDPLPQGFARSWQDQRNVARSLRSLRAAARSGKITPQTAVAYLDRKYRRASPLDGASSIGTLWVYARLGRLEEIVSLTEGQPVLAASLARAWTQLADAVDAAAVAVSLLAGWAGEDEPQDLEAGKPAVAALAWAQPRLADRLANHFDVVRTHGTGWPVLRAALERLRSQCSPHSHHLVPTRLADFSVGQQRTIVTMLSGPAESRTRR